MQIAVAHAALIGNVIAHRVALKEVTVIDQDRVRRFCPNLFDDRGRARQPNRINRFVGVIIVGVHVNVQICCGKNAKVRLICRGHRRERVQRNKRTGRGGAGKKLTTGKTDSHGDPLC